MTTTAIAIEDMHCAACTSKIERALMPLSGIGGLRFNPVRRHVIVEHEAEVAASDLIERIEEAGFHPALLSSASAGRSDADRTLLKRLGIAGLAMMQVMMVQIALYAGAFQGMDAAYARLLELTALMFCVPVVSYSALPFFISAARSLRHGLNMDTPIALAIVIAFSASVVATISGTGESYYDSVVMFTFLMLGARYLEQRLKHRLSLEDSLLASLPAEAQVEKRDGSLTTVAVTALRAGDVLWIGEGEQLPADGVLLSGAARLEEALLTGESDWVSRDVGDMVHAGTFNRGGAVRMRVTAVGENARIGQIDQLSTAALQTKHNLARLADRVARYFIPCILTLAGITYGVWLSLDAERAFSAALAVLVVSCPCALSLATPAAITAALSRLRQAGVLVKSGTALERAGSVKRVFVDKTGTLTEPDFVVSHQHTFPGFDHAHCRHVAETLQAYASHPVARAFRGGKHTDANDVSVSREGVAGSIDGKVARIGSADFAGFAATEDADGKTVYLTVAGAPAATFTVEAPVRRDAAQTISTLKARGLDVHMLSGDQEAHCAQLAAKLNMSYSSGLTPEGKNAALAREENFLFVGDGMNDLPAIARAAVSVSTLETNDLVKSRSDVVLLTKRLLPVVDLLNVSAAAHRIMWQNLRWAIAYNIVAIPLAALGYAPPWAAALGMSASSVGVMLNATRVLNTPLAKENR